MPFIVWQDVNVRIDCLEEQQQQRLANPNWRANIRYAVMSHETQEAHVMPITTRNLILGPDGRPLEAMR